MLRELIEQITMEEGRLYHPTDNDIQRAMTIYEADKVHKISNNLAPHKEFPFPNDYGYDIECYPNFFSCSIQHILTFRRWRFEISDWVHQGRELYELLMSLRHNNCRLVGFNNEHYDYPIIHLLMEQQGIITNEQLIQRSRDIFSDHTGYKYNVWPNNRFLAQVDLFKIHHFDNQAKRTSLKMLEFNMRSPNIKDLPFDPTKPITEEQRLPMLTYNDHDVDETCKVYMHSLPMIEFREQLSQRYGKDFTNYNDTKIGKEYFIMKLAEKGIYIKDEFNQLIQTKRDSINIADVIIPYVQFERPEFNEILTFFRNSVVDKKDSNGMLELKGFFSDVSATLDGFKFDFGAGGIHGSIHKTVVTESDTHLLIDIDVASYYPNLAIANGFYPEHLTDVFCDIYLDVYNQRKQFGKGTPENAMLKLALNGVYGASNDKFSPFLDAKYTLAITINGQLLLCMLAEQLLKVPDLKMVQVNTDGLTFLCPRQYEQHVMSLKTWWEQLTKLELERADYNKMAIRDVNSYLAVTKDGKVKRIGAYAYELALDNASTRELAWHKNQSAVVVAKAAEAALVHNKSIPDFIHNHENEYDFMLRTKVPRSSRLELHEDLMWGRDVITTRKTVLQNISRYYVSETGGQLFKVMPPTPTTVNLWLEGDHYQHKNTGDYVVKNQGVKPPSGMYLPVIKPDRNSPPERYISEQAGFLVTDCSDMENYYKDNAPEINYDYYINETRKLVDELLL